MGGFGGVGVSKMYGGGGGVEGRARRNTWWRFATLGMSRRCFFSLFEDHGA